jgi:DNA repair exonuclease SbcCD ATPase subunit
VRKLQQSQSRLSAHLRKTDQFLYEREEKLEKICREQKAIESEKELILLKKENAERSYKQTVEKLLAERDELQKQVRKVQGREKAFEAEFRKKDSQIVGLQDRIKRMQEKPSSKTTFEVYEPAAVGRREGGGAGVEEYNSLALEKVEESLKLLSN